ncbi:MAG TPA: CRISPR-associated helicase Cas3' [Geobacteraceae bacterium]
MNTSIFDFWGKAERNGSGWHPAVCHMLDTGIVAREILKLQPQTFRQRFTSCLGLDEADALNAIALIASLHDIGKISPGFQTKRIDLCGQLKARGFSLSNIAEPNHGRVAMDALPEIFEEIFGCTPQLAYALSCILAAHHGVFDNSDGVGSGDKPWQEARREAVGLLSRTFGVESLSTLRLSGVPDLFLLAGLISVADWIASDEKTFGYLNATPADIDLYVQERSAIAGRLFDRLSLGTTVEGEKNFSELFEFATPNACQQATLDVIAGLSHPMLVVVETPMGSGKTEAAQAAYSYIAVRDGLRGMYCALPTQATGNAMFRRMADFLGRLHDAQTVELHLLHANAGMHKEYDCLKIAAIDADRKGTVVASSWFAQRKRGLLAAYGTGTIDQALMAILRVKHFFVRLFGLGGKLIVLDEVHAYDAYMSEEIYNLIGWASRCGSSIVLLSATLPANKRKRLVEAFLPSAQLPPELEYPCVFGVDLHGKPAYRPVAMTPSVLEISPVIVDQKNKLRTMADKLVEVVGAAGCAACILNTVADAQDMYELLKEGFPEEELILFHSRFTLERRLEIEEEIIGSYGKDGRRPRRGVVVASPVLQESLDVCFDAMFSELAPIDLLLQRAGRLHRHEMHANDRPVHLQTRRLHVFLPDVRVEQPDFGWSKLIYFPDLLCRSGELFINREKYCAIQVQLPKGVSPLIERVYSEADSGELNKRRAKWLEERLGTEISNAWYARVAAIMSVKEKEYDLDYLAGIQNDHEDETTPSTRLGRQRVTLIILEQGYDIAIPTREAERRLFLKSLATDKAALVKHFASLEPCAPWSESALLRYCQPVFFANGIANAGELTLTYDRIKGLSIKQDKERDE